jgi:hypothetical protein
VQSSVPIHEVVFDSIVQTSPKPKKKKKKKKGGRRRGLWATWRGEGFFFRYYAYFVAEDEDAWKNEEEKGFIYLQNHKLFHKWRKIIWY